MDNNGRDPGEMRDVSNEELLVKVIEGCLLEYENHRMPFFTADIIKMEARQILATIKMYQNLFDKEKNNAIPRNDQDDGANNSSVSFRVHCSKHGNVLHDH